MRLPSTRRTAHLLFAFLPLALIHTVRADQANSAPTQGLPLKQVSLFSSGVGYFGREGRITGDGQVELFFRRDDLNDVLKSLVISDPSGELRPVTYSLDELLARRPATNDLPLPHAETLGGVLRNFQGALLEIQSGEKIIRGRLLGVATKTIKDKDGTVTQIEIANILTESGGLVAFRLDGLEDGGVVRLLDPALNDKLRAQLEQRALQLTSRTDDSFRPIKLNFAGRGAREVRAGYIQSTSVWKTSYRLAFDSKAASKSKDKKAKADAAIKPLLQGWGIVENTTDEDWKDVQLSLIAGRPVSFVMNLAAPLYVSRPEIPLPFAGAPAPKVYEEMLEPVPAITAPKGPQGPPDLANRAGGNFALADDATQRTYARKRQNIAVSAEELMQQEAQAAGEARGELFEYAIRQPVTLLRGEAALVPIVSQPIEGKKLSILDTAEPTLRAVHGLRIENTSGLHLAGGPLTIYQDGLYAGDAQITNIAPGDTRLISYALDLDLVVGRESPAFAEETIGLSARAGVLTISRKQRKTETWTLRNKSAQPKTVLVQTPIDPNFELVEPATPTEKTTSHYRFEVPVAAKDASQFTLVSERQISQTVALVAADLNVILNYVRWGKISPQLRAALESVVEKRRKLLDLQSRRAALETQINEITQEQNRIRGNMNSLSQNSELYKRYVAKLDEQETQIEKLREEIARLREAENDAAKELRAFTDTLNVDN